MQGNDGRVHHSTGLGTLPDTLTPPSRGPCSTLQLLLLDMSMTTILALPLASGSQAQGLRGSCGVSYIQHLPGQGAHPACLFVITLVWCLMVAKGYREPGRS